MSNNIKKVLLAGGGTGGSVMPLLAMVEELTSPLSAQTGSDGARYDFLWLGTKSGPEKVMIEKENIRFIAIANGKLRRYFSWRNFIDPFLVKIGFWQALFIMLKWRPDLVISAGSFVGAPVVWAAWALRVPVLIHQQDVRPGLANKLMTLFARVITVTFKKSLEDYGQKAIWIGNPVRSKKLSPPQRDPARAGEVRNKNYEKFGLKENLPVVLVVGGGTGALAINELVEQSIEELTKFCQIIHITGKDKGIGYPGGYSMPYYHTFEFLNAQQMAQAYTVADIVVSRCGMGALTELSYLGKPAILIPIPDSHQEDNAKVFYQLKAAIVLDQNELTPENFVSSIKKLVYDSQLRNKLRNNIKQIIKPGANKKIAKIIKELIE